ncbi:hypothetical protein ANCCAN_18520 [Ancylostoma caninum]|uniref:Uncharacterized protein n=1 Tax=Ancylostoma caninum TaxID=29170 RepID=A0A368FTW5_ANCCA|nr:hypothetical protein ANCCAN_18520 [Ancylostoma caninum]
MQLVICKKEPTMLKSTTHVVVQAVQNARTVQQAGEKSSTEGKSSTTYCSTNVSSNEEESKSRNVADQRKLRESLEVNSFYDKER